MAASGANLHAYQGPSVFARNATVIGGLHEAGIASGFSLIGGVAPFLNVGQFVLEVDKLTMRSPYLQALIFSQALETYGAWAFRSGQNGGAQQLNLILAGAGKDVHTGTKFRTPEVAATSIPTLLAAGVRYGALDMIDDLFSQAQVQVHLGDYYVNTSCDGTTPAGWCCFQAGTTGTLLSGSTGVSNSINFEFFPTNSQYLRPGDTVQIGNAIGTLASKGPPSNYTGGPTYQTEWFHQYDPNTYPVTYAALRLRTVGDGAGLPSRRPVSLRADDAGWRYFATGDPGAAGNDTWSTWNGSAWV